MCVCVCIYVRIYVCARVCVCLCVQVAHFYNTIDQQMIPSQQPMMLEAAMAFEHIIKNPTGSSKASDGVRGGTVEMLLSVYGGSDP